jgi:hypothetical protein
VPNPYTDGKSVDELIDFLAKGGADPDSAVGQAVRAAITARLSEGSNAVARRSQRVAVLALVVAILGAGASVYQAVTSDNADKAATLTSEPMTREQCTLLKESRTAQGLPPGTCGPN